MTITDQHRPTEPYVVARDDGSHHHFLNHLATTKVAAGPDGSMSAVEFVAPQGFGPPLHRHLDEDELVVVLEGSIAFRSGDQEHIGGVGACAYLPRNIPHTFQVLSEQARFLSVTASSESSPRFDQMVAALGTPSARPTQPEPGPIDPAHVAAVTAAHGIEVLGPPPAPLADGGDAR
ncbi:MAG TPA: cupin domain-containing protein [Acidimicrobiales bacterium]|nr:cupin domain-containing protein [Acidimicrobiales bacterium]